MKKHLLIALLVLVLCIAAGAFAEGSQDRAGYSFREDYDALDSAAKSLFYVEVYNRELLPLWNTMFELAEEYMAYCEDVMREEVPDNLMTQFNFCMHSVPFLRGMVVEGLLETGFLKPEEELSDMIGVYMVVD